jgi:ABC-type multidrug transport system fused ATPase/permease subunit
MSLFILMVLVAFIETLGVGTILPFVAVAANPTALDKVGPLGAVYRWSGAESENQFLLLLGSTVLLVVVAGNALKALSTWLTHRFSQMAGHALAIQLFSSYLARPYEYFLTRHSADLGTNILQEVHQVVNGVVFPAMSALSRLITVVLLVALLFVADPWLTLSAIISLGGAYGIIYALTRTLQARLGNKHIAADHGRYYIASEVFSGVKDIKLRGLEAMSIERFAVPSLSYARGLALSMMLSQTPRFFVEVVAFGGVIAILLYLLTARDGIADVLPLVSLYVFAGYRLLPALQEIFSSATRIRFSWPSLVLIHQEMADAPTPAVRTFVCAALPFTYAIRLEKVSYRYPFGEREVLTDVSLDIPHGARVGFIGPTGSGKSTTVDLILGLLRPMEGRILIDDTPLTDEETIRRWQARIGYVAQHIFLADDTIAANIAFGQRVGEIDRAEVERAARMAQFHDFIVNALPEGYETQIGERGVRLSGGERQRLGLARALYGNPAVLVLDEAMSALDDETEAMVMKVLDAIGRDVTIIAIAHRISTIRRSDLIFRMEEGRLAASGPSEDVLETKGAELERGRAG